MTYETVQVLSQISDAIKLHMYKASAAVFYLAKVTLSENSQEIKIIQTDLATNLQWRYSLLRWWLWLLLAVEK